MKNSDILTESLKNVEITFYTTNGRNTARYVSDTTVREEALEHGRLIGLYWSAGGQIQYENVTINGDLPGSPAKSIDGIFPGLDSLAKPLHVFDLEIDGQLLHNHWKWISASKRKGERSGTIEAVVELAHQIRPISVKIVTRLDGSPVLTRWLEITNKGSVPAALSHVSSWSGVLWHTNPSWNPSVKIDNKTIFSLGYLVSEDWGKEGNFVWRDLPSENYRIERSIGCTNGSPYFMLRNDITGEMFWIALAWSGSWYAEFSCRGGTTLSFRIGPHGPSPQRVIAPDETVKTPEVHLAPLHASMDTAVYKWHKHIRSSVLPPRPQGKEMYTIAGRVVEKPGDWILKEIDIAAEMGCEAFMVDAGWYGEKFAHWREQRGDWFEGNWLPGGIAGIRDYARSKGMLFGLWIEPEAITEKSHLYKKHPEWVLTTDDERLPTTTVLNLGNAETARYVEDTVLNILRDFDLDFHKIDYNVRILEGGQNLRDGFAEHEAWRHCEVIYNLYDKVHKEIPHIALENCAGGGGRNDLGMLSRFHYACESDISTFPISIRAINSMSLFLPPEAICYYHNLWFYAHHLADLDTHLRVTLFCNPIFVGFGAQNSNRSATCFKKTRRYIELFKAFCKPILVNHPLVYHHTPDIGLLEPADWCVLEYAAKDRKSGYAGIFKLSGGDSEYLFRPRGIDTGTTYKVIMDNSSQTAEISGWELINKGLTIRLDSALTSELLMFSSI